jgi:hypothetical protein
MEDLSQRTIVWDLSTSHLDDRIRQLCARVVAAGEEDLGPAISDLKSALREHNDRLRKMAASTLGFLLSSPKEPSIKDPSQSN